MRKLRKLFATFGLSFCMLTITAMPVMASETQSADFDDNDTREDREGSNEGLTGSNGYGYTSDDTLVTHNAIQDIMQSSAFTGAVDSISKITDFVDTWFTRIISIVAFFIISAALLKNACAGAYVANSKFWDKVDDAHKKAEALNINAVKQYFGGQQFMNTTAGGLRDGILCIVPNIKAFTDFDDADIEPKAYFMKAIPQMVVCVVIGIFIYNGYYRDTAATVGDMGSVLIERALGSVQPEQFVNKIFNTTSWPDFPTVGDSSRQGKAELTISKAIRSAIISEFTDIQDASAKSQVTGNIAFMAHNITEGITVAGASWENSSTSSAENTYWELASVKAIVTSSANIQSIYGGSEETQAVQNMDGSDEEGNPTVVSTVTCFRASSIKLNSTILSNEENDAILVRCTYKLKTGSGGLGATSVVTSLTEASSSVNKGELVGVNPPLKCTSNGDGTVNIAAGTTIDITAFGCTSWEGIPPKIKIAGSVSAKTRTFQESTNYMLDVNGKIYVGMGRNDDGVWKLYATPSY